MRKKTCHYKHLAGSFWVLRQNLQQVAPNQEKPHTTPFHYLIYSIYISVLVIQKVEYCSFFGFATYLAL